MSLYPTLLFKMLKKKVFKKFCFVLVLIVVPTENMHDSLLFWEEVED